MPTISMSSSSSPSWPAAPADEDDPLLRLAGRVISSMLSTGFDATCSHVVVCGWGRGGGEAAEVERMG